jgi:hypothetical protein
MANKPNITTKVRMMYQTVLAFTEKPPEQLVLSEQDYDQLVESAAKFSLIPVTNIVYRSGDISVPIVKRQKQELPIST